MEYKKNWQEVIKRQTAFWNKKMSDQILARIYVKNKIFDEWLNKKGKEIPAESENSPNPHLIFEMWDHKLQILKHLEDDSLPVMIPTEFDEGLYGGIFGSRVTFTFDKESGWLGSMATPFLDDYSDLNKLQIKNNNLWLQELSERLKLYKKLSIGKFGISPIISIDALNFAVLSRGASRAMLDLYDNPLQLKNLFEFALNFSIRMNKYQKRFIGSFRNGTFDGYAGFGSWFLGEQINISVDVFGLCKKEVYEQFGFEYTQKLIDAFGSAFLHIHGNAHHLLSQVVKLRGLRGIWIVDEAPHPFFRLAEIKKTTGDIPIVTECMVDEFIEAMDRKTLPGGVFYILRGHMEGRCTLQSPAVEDITEANKIMRRVKEYKQVV